ncbi:hypothetical protein [Mycobacterium ahvazicum]|uniref:hypothetical protein n=1 Tax=Mycobacterium ahvazicum TaxID=1964395 RepID=UPI0013FDB8B9|nr:hypothetical protein [Mycobacterium ahvazicum]
MNDRESGPPNEEKAPRGLIDSFRGHHTTSTNGPEYRRRYAAKLRATPLGACSCIRDPEFDRHRCGRNITDAQVDGAAAALNHLATLGYPGIVDIDTCRGLWRRGHRALAVDYSTRPGAA